MNLTEGYESTSAPQMHLPIAKMLNLVKEDYERVCAIRAAGLNRIREVARQG